MIVTGLYGDLGRPDNSIMYFVSNEAVLMKEGDRVKVQSSVIVYHHPEHRNRPFDIKGFEGEVIAIKQEWDGRAISPNYPIHVKFDQRFRAHLAQDEIVVA